MAEASCSGEPLGQKGVVQETPVASSEASSGVVTDSKQCASLNFNQVNVHEQNSLDSDPSIQHQVGLISNEHEISRSASIQQETESTSSEYETSKIASIQQQSSSTSDEVEPSESNHRDQTNASPNDPKPLISSTTNPSSKNSKIDEQTLADNASNPKEAIAERYSCESKVSNEGNVFADQVDSEQNVPVPDILVSIYVALSLGEEASASTSESTDICSSTSPNCRDLALDETASKVSEKFSSLQVGTNPNSVSKAAPRSPRTVEKSQSPAKLPWNVSKVDSKVNFGSAGKYKISTTGPSRASSETKLSPDFANRNQSIPSKSPTKAVCTPLGTKFKTVHSKATSSVMPTARSQLSASTKSEQTTVKKLQINAKSTSNASSRPGCALPLTPASAKSELSAVKKLQVTLKSVAKSSPKPGCSIPQNNVAPVSRKASVGKPVQSRYLKCHEKPGKETSKSASSEAKGTYVKRVPSFKMELSRPGTSAKPSRSPLTSTSKNQKPAKETAGSTPDVESASSTEQAVKESVYSSESVSPVSRLTSIASDKSISHCGETTDLKEKCDSKIADTLLPNDKMLNSNAAKTDFLNVSSATVTLKTPSPSKIARFSYPAIDPKPRAESEIGSKPRPSSSSKGPVKEQVVKPQRSSFPQRTAVAKRSSFPATAKIKDPWK